MNFRLHTMIFQILLQLVTTLTQHWEDMPYAISIGLWNRDSRIFHLIHIYSSQFLTA